MPIGSPQWMYASGEDAFTIDQSLRFNDDDDAKLSRTPSSAGNRKTWTLSVWIKRGNLGSEQGILTGKIANDDTHTFKIASSDQISIFSRISGANTKEYYGVSRLRDTGAWYHIVFAFDTTQSTEADRVKVWINGVAESFTGVTAFPEDYEPYINSTVEHNIGNFQDSSTSLDFDGYLAEMHFIDGTALTPASFGETGDYGEWKPIEVEGLTYGTNGFYLSFAGGGIMSATGGDSIGTDGDYKYNTFLSSATFTPSADGFVEYLVIGGGGGGGNTYGGGGGAGGYRTGYLAVTASTAYSITVGTGGARSTSVAAGSSGTNSVFSTITSDGGGGGGGWNTTGGGNGGSGGGASGGDGPYTGGTPTSGQGYAGGTSEDNYSGGGGGGAGAVGANGTDEGAGVAGGAGLASSITGSSVTRAGGGGSGSWYNNNGVGSGGSGGGGNGASFNTASTSPTANTGSGGGGGNHGEGNPLGTNGATGVVILRYKFQ
jgi:hypothetical protein